MKDETILRLRNGDISCKDCCFFIPRDDGKTGECHRFPPDTYKYIYEWCGEWREIPRGPSQPPPKGDAHDAG